VRITPTKVRGFSPEGFQDPLLTPADPMKARHQDLAQRRLAGLSMGWVMVHPSSAVRSPSKLAASADVAGGAAGLVAVGGRRVGSVGVTKYSHVRRR